MRALKLREVFCYNNIEYILLCLFIIYDCVISVKDMESDYSEKLTVLIIRNESGSQDCMPNRLIDLPVYLSFLFGLLHSASLPRLCCELSCGHFWGIHCCFCSPGPLASGWKLMLALS